MFTDDDFSLLVADHTDGMLACYSYKGGLE